MCITASIDEQPTGACGAGRALISGLRRTFDCTGLATVPPRTHTSSIGSGAFAGKPRANQAGKK